MNSFKKGIFTAILAAMLYALNAPFSKLLLDYIPSTLLAGLLYLGAGLGMGAVASVRALTHKGGRKEASLTKSDLPYTLAMILLDIAAPICLMAGLNKTAAANASLLNNFEIPATALIALMLFGERVSPRLWLGIICVTLSCAVLSFEDMSSLSFSSGSLLVMLASACWGLENNCTRRLSQKDPLQIVLLKGIFSGGGALLIGLILGEKLSLSWAILGALAVGLVAYGLSIYFYVYAQRVLGAARTGAYYAAAPFISAALSLVIFKQAPSLQYLAALAIMMAGAFLSSGDTPLKQLFPRKKRG